MITIKLGPQLQPHHDKLTEIFVRAEKKKAEREKLEQQNPPKNKPA